MVIPKSNYSFTKKTLSIFWTHSKKYPWHIFGLLSGILIVTVLQTYTPVLYKDLINVLSLGNFDQNIQKAIGIVVVILVFNFIRTSLWRASTFVNNYFQPRVMSDLTNTCYNYLLKHSLGFFNSNFVGSIVTKVRRYERSFEQIADQFYFDLGRSILDTAMILVVLLWQYQQFGLLVLAWCIVYFLFSYFYSIYKLPYDIKRSASDTRTTAQLADSITNNVNIKLFNSLDFENKRFKEVTGEQFRLRKKSWDLGSIGEVIQGLMMVGLEFLIIYLAIRNFQAGSFLVGDIVLLQTFLLRMFDKLWNTGKNIRNIYESLADANEMTEMLSSPHGIQDTEGALALKFKQGHVEFKNVEFGYGKETKILKNFSLSINPGERIAFIGPSGGGKSTIAKLLLRFYDLQKGEILIDSQNIAKVTQDSLRENLAFVPQDPILFHRSLMENIRYSRPSATDDEVVEAAKAAHAHEFIISFTDGYKTLVGERGIKLSGGERQRVAIARAILKNSPILLLDEATSSLDSQSEFYIQDALKRLMQNKTTIVIAHRLSTIMQMDRIVVIENGMILEQGKHTELLKVKKGLYQKLWGIQVGGFKTNPLST